MHTNGRAVLPAGFSVLPIPLGSGCLYKHEWSSALEGTHSLDRVASEELAVLGTTEDQTSSSPRVLVLE